MRISTSQQYYNGKQNMLDSQAKLNKLQNQLSTGRKVMSPSDDPVAAARGLLVSQSQSVNKQYMNNQDIALQQLDMTDSILGNMSSTLTNVVSSAVQGGNGAYSAAERRSIATELKQQLSALVDMANSKTATGEYIFGGYRSNEKPFSDSGSGITYNGNGGTQQLQVESSSQVSITENGSEVFMRVLDKNGNPIPDGSGNNQTLFGSLQKMIDFLEGASGTSKADYDRELDNLNASLDHISRERASVGARQAMVTSLNASSQDLDGQYAATLSSLQDLDYAAAISDFTFQQTQLQAAQQTFSKVSQSSLFNYL